MVRRVLGGGCGYCDEDQILFSVIASEGGGTVPTDIQGAYSRVLGGLINTLRMLGFDGKPEPRRNAVYSMGRKISGNAQGRFDGAVLLKQLDGLPDPVYDRIIKKIKMLEEHPRPRGCIKLKGYENEYRIRIGNYRIHYKVCDQEFIIILLHCKHRKSEYKD